MQVSAVITASGLGKRMGGALKQFLPLGDKPLIVHAITPFQTCAAITEIILVVPNSALTECQSGIVDAYALDKVSRVVAGGKERTDSVYQGLRSVNKAADYVLIHDGVRPFVSQNLIEQTLQAAIEYGAAIPARPLIQTIKLADDDGFVRQTLDRSRLYGIQTPQAFRYSLLLEAYEKCYQSGDKVTDDSQMCEQIGCRVKIIPGEAGNLKITTRHDLVFAEFYLQGLQEKPE